MVHSCSVVGCTNRTDAAIKRRFFGIPVVKNNEGEKTRELSERRRNTWLARLNRKNFQPSRHTKICSDHFVTGNKADLYNVSHPDWAPSLKLAPEQTPKTEQIEDIPDLDQMKDCDLDDGNLSSDGCADSTEDRVIDLNEPILKKRKIGGVRKKKPKKIIESGNRHMLCKSTERIVACKEVMTQTDYSWASPMELFALSAEIHGLKERTTSQETIIEELKEQLRQAKKELEDKESRISFLERIKTGFDNFLNLQKEPK